MRRIPWTSIGYYLALAALIPYGAWFFCWHLGRLTSRPVRFAEHKRITVYDEPAGPIDFHQAVNERWRWILDAKHNRDRQLIPFPVMVLADLSDPSTRKTAAYLAGDDHITEAPHAGWNCGVARVEDVLPRLHISREEIVRIVDTGRTLVVVVGGGTAALFMSEP